MNLAHRWQVRLGQRSSRRSTTCEDRECGSSDTVRRVAPEWSFNQAGRRSVNELFGRRRTSFPKPTARRRYLLVSCRELHGDTGHRRSRLLRRVRDDWSCRDGAERGRRWARGGTSSSSCRSPWIRETRPSKAAADFCDSLGRPRNIAELTKERLRRAGAKIRDENPMFAGDTGFRVFKLDSTNIQAWEPDRDDLEETLEGAVEHLKTDRTEQDILYELLLKLGLDLCVPIERRDDCRQGGPRRRRRRASGLPRAEHRPRRCRGAGTRDRGVVHGARPGRRRDLRVPGQRVRGRCGQDELGRDPRAARAHARAEPVVAWRPRQRGWPTGIE